MTAEPRASRRGSPPVALLVVLCLAAGLALGLGVAVLHRQGQSLPFWDARTPTQKWHDAWVAEAGALTWPSKAPAVRPYTAELGVDGQEARTLVDAAWECDWVPIWLKARSHDPKRAAKILGSMSTASLGTGAVEPVLDAMRGGDIVGVRQNLSADC